MKWKKKQWLKLKSKKFIEISVKFCEVLKKAIDNGDFDLFCKAADIVIPGDQAPIFAIVKTKLNDNLPKIISSLQIVSVLSNVDKDDIKAQMEAVFKALTGASDGAKIGVWRGLSEEIVEYFEDGVFTTSEKRQLIDSYYNQIKGK